MVGSIDPRCETVRGTHWPKPGRVVDWNSRRGNHLGQRFKPTASTGRTYGCKRSDLTQKTLVPRGPSTYGSPLSRGRRRGVHKKTGPRGPVLSSSLRATSIVAAIEAVMMVMMVMTVSARHDDCARRLIIPIISAISVVVVMVVMVELGKLNVFVR